MSAYSGIDPSSSDLCIKLPVLWLVGCRGWFKMGVLTGAYLNKHLLSANNVPLKVFEPSGSFYLELFLLGHMANSTLLA